MNALKTVGTRTAAATPAESLRTALQLQRVARRLGKWTEARGFVVKGRTREEAEERWQEAISNLAKNDQRN